MINLIGFSFIQGDRIKAVATIEFSKGLVIKGFKICESTNGEVYIIAPQEVFHSKRGEKKKRKVVILSDELRREVHSVLLNAYEYLSGSSEELSSNEENQKEE